MNAHMVKESQICPYCGVYSTITLVACCRRHFIYRCDHCNEDFLLIVEGNKIVDQYPKRTPKLDVAIPLDVANDYVEAIKCFDISAYKASVVMCRRALQTSVIDKGAGKGRLVDQIDELSTKGTITEDIKNWAHEIRLTANIGAHPDGLEDVARQDAEDLIKFTEEYLNYVYIMPSKVAAKRARDKAR
jgi:hypothetical protein